MSAQGKLPLPQKRVVTVGVSCCYCGAKQSAPEPPSLHTCIACHRDFRVYKNAAGVKPMEITERAKRFYARAPTGTESA